MHRSLDLTTDANGSFRFENVVPGSVALKAESSDYLFRTQSLELHAREDAHPELGLHKRPKVSLVQVGANEIKLKQQLHFENDSAVIALDSNAGTPQHNSALFEARASAVLEWLTSQGIDGARLRLRSRSPHRAERHAGWSRPQSARAVQILH